MIFSEKGLRLRKLEETQDGQNSQEESWYKKENESSITSSIIIEWEWML